MRKASQKDFTAVREKTTRFADAIKKDLRYADLKDHGGHATVKMRWGMNESAIRDLVFELSINGEKAYIDLEELLTYTRLM